MKYKYLLSFDNEEWIEISKFINTKNTTLTRTFLSSSYASSTNVLSFQLISRKEFADEHADLVIRIIDALVASEKIYIKFYEDDEIEFNGLLDSRGVSQTISTRAEEVSITAYDFTYLLDETMEDSFEYPSDFTQDEDGLYLFRCDYTKANDDLIPILIQKAGFTISDIDFDNSVPIMRYDNPTEYRLLRHIAYDSDDERTYRDVIDILLHENCKVLTTGKDGRFIIQNMYPTVDSQSQKVGIMTHLDSFNISLSTRDYNGIKLTWSTLSTINAKIYDGNLGGTINDDGTDFEGGFEMDGGSYWPETSDIEEVWQEFSSSWLDRPYYTKVSRLKNDDVSLLSAKNIIIDAYMDDEIVLDDGYPIAESLRAMFRYKNTSDDTKYFHRFVLFGDCLYRYKINTYTYPETSSNPEEYESEFIFKEEQANEYCYKLAKLKNYGIMQYTWSQLGEIKEGDIIHISPKNTRIDTDVIITSVTYKYQGKTRYYYVTAQGFGDYTSDVIRKQATNVGATTGNIGNDGVDGTSVLVEYAKNTSLDTPPDPDTIFKFKDKVMYFKGKQMGIANWFTESPLASDLEDNEYVWQRNSK